MEVSVRLQGPAATTGPLAFVGGWSPRERTTRPGRTWAIRWRLRGQREQPWAARSDRRMSVVLAANHVWPQSHSPAAAPVRGCSLGLATPDRPLEGAPGKDVGYNIP